MKLAQHAGQSALDALCRPSVMELQPGLTAVQFDLMKIIPARYILENALATGLLKPGGLVFESSSGTFALGLAQVCANVGLRLSLVTGPMEESLSWRLTQLGATITSIPPTNTLGGMQQARLDKLHEFLAQNPDAFWPRQYTNPLHPEAYGPLAAEIGQDVGAIDFLVASVGSGGSICGFSRVLRKTNPGLQVVGVDHNLSVLFGPTTGQATPLCHECYVPLLGMGSDIVIPNLDHTECDEVHWVPVAKMIRATHELHRKLGLLVGPTAGAAYVVAQWIAARNPGKRVLVLFPDHGIRYLRSIFEPGWLAQREAEIRRDWPEPEVVGSPTEVGEAWARFAWGRRSYREVLGHDPVSR